MGVVVVLCAAKESPSSQKKSGRGEKEREHHHQVPSWGKQHSTAHSLLCLSLSLRPSFLSSQPPPPPPPPAPSPSSSLLCLRCSLSFCILSFPLPLHLSEVLHDDSFTEALAVHTRYDDHGQFSRSSDGPVTHTEKPLIRSSLSMSRCGIEE